MDDYTEKKLKELRDELRKTRSRKVMIWGITGPCCFLGRLGPRLLGVAQISCLQSTEGRRGRVEEG